MAWAEGGRLWKGWIDRGGEGALGGSWESGAAWGLRVREYSPPPKALWGEGPCSTGEMLHRCEGSEGPFLHAVLTSRATRGRTGR